MTPHQVELVEQTMERAAQDLDAVVVDFYDRLFRAHPEVRGMFPEDMGEQRHKLEAMLRTVVASIRDHGRFEQACARLGARHEGYGARAAHYEAVGSALLAALGAALGDAWHEEERCAWQAALELVSEVMQGGQRAAVTA
ncbi:hemoglobin-like flavoprotein [Motilibacter rhizosphaerae]|uniref:Hemoglobin-like flavoprotein n=1 Tax=Motilibacter rhizosphaerae TaxID=598652 RepID=A0A4Q7NQ87_9ACTN|nr:globin domain-containing protein [Motilibacter rhizosphaerae]RZS87495.1 hemoglobin-like flavoprotein [Motilibacter rhizosphaerae]